jgi:hypothetical protein
MTPGLLIQLSISQGVQLECGAVDKLLATRPSDKHGLVAVARPVVTMVTSLRTLLRVMSLPFVARGRCAS